MDVCLTSKNSSCYGPVQHEEEPRHVWPDMPSGCACKVVAATTSQPRERLTGKTESLLQVSLCQ